MPSAPDIRADFDRIAALNERSYDHATRYYPYLLRHLPTPCNVALDVGCGAGDFTRRLAAYAHQVEGIDLSPAMIDVARQRASKMVNIAFQVTDIRQWPLETERYDCIASIATLHHLSLVEVLPRLIDSLRPGGVLLMLDLLAPDGPADMLRNFPAAVVSMWLRWRATGQLRPSPAMRAAWAAHAAHDTYLTMAQVHAIAREHLPQAVIRQHLLWRYSIVWRKSK